MPTGDLGRLLDRLPSAALFVSRGGTISEANPAFERLSGWSREELLGRSVEELVPTDVRREHERLRADHESRQGGRIGSDRLDMRLLRADGSEVETDVSLASWSADGVEGTLVLVRDLTRQRAVEEAARSAERRWRRLFESSPAGLSRSSLDGRLLECNASFAQLFGFGSPAEIEGADVHDLYVDPSEREAVVARLRDAAGESTTAELRARRKDGEELAIEVVGHLVETDDGPVIEAAILDVTEQRRAEDALRESEAQLRSLIDSTRAVLWRADARTLDFTFVSQQAPRLLGHPASKWLENGFWLDHLHPDDRAAAERYCREQTAAGRDHVFEYRMVRADGRIVWIQDSVTIVHSASGETQELLGALIDITDRKELEIQLQQSQRVEAVGQLAGGIAHDFNNLISVIGGYTELLLESRSADDPDRRPLEEVRQAAERASRLTRQLLAFSRRQVLRPRRLDLNRTISEFEGILRRVLGEHVAIELDLDDGLWPIRADPVQLEQVLMNLAVNARDAMPNGGRLELSTRNEELDEQFVTTHPGGRTGSFVCLQVRDDGVGMDPAVLARIYEPFFTTKEQSRGSGLGLSTVYGIVKQSDGYIKAESDPGRGATFTIYLPRDRAGDSGEVAIEAPASRPTSRRGERILVVEDAAPLLRLVREVLRRSGYEVLEATSGEDAIRRLTAEPDSIDLLLTDLVMPGMSGTELAARAREIAPRTRTLLMSGYSEDVIGELPADGPPLLEKPFTSQQLLERVRESLES